MATVEHRVPEWKPRTAGETGWFGTPRRYQGQAYLVAAMVEPQRAFTMVAPQDWQKLEAAARGEVGSWGFVLVPIDATHAPDCTVARWQAPQPAGAGRRCSLPESVHWVRERKMLLTIKRLSETTP
jgi:hypothetical protein